jgi:rhomboid family protein
MFFPFHDESSIRHRAWVTYSLIAINVVVFVWFIRLSMPGREAVILRRGFIPARVGQFFSNRPIVAPQKVVVYSPFFGKKMIQRGIVFPPDRGAIFSSMITSLFLHGGWMHLIGNMWFLLIFGVRVEDQLGRGPFLFFYIFGGIVASMVHWSMDMNSLSPVIGASGAVAAMLGAYAIKWPWARIHTLVFLFFFVTIIEVPAMLVLGIWFAMQLMEGHAQLSLHTSGGVAWWAHVGGFLVGLALMPLLDLWINGRQPPETPLTFNRSSETNITE